MFKTIFNIIFAVIFGALGALLFAVFLLPYLLTNSYFENYQFVKDFKQDKIVINQTDKIYIQENTALQDAILRVKPSIVMIQSPVLGIISGLIASSDGNIITLASAASQTGKVFLEGEQVPYTLVKTDKKSNLALLKIDKNNLQTVSFTNISALTLGKRVFLTSADSVKMDNWFANEGIISEIGPDLLKTTITERAMANGSPLFNSAGELIGLNMVDAIGKVSVIPIDKIQALLGL